MNDDELVSQAIQEAEVDFIKRKAEFCERLGITSEQYKEASLRHIDYCAIICGIRPFHRAPIAHESFIAGYWMRSNDT